jgi:hypothetical protein
MRKKVNLNFYTEDGSITRFRKLSTYKTITYNKEEDYSFSYCFSLNNLLCVLQNVGFESTICYIEF